MVSESIPWLELSSTEFKPLWLGNVPALWNFHFFFWEEGGVDLFRPWFFSPIHPSNPSGDCSALNSSVSLKPIGVLMTQLNGLLLATEPNTNSIFVAVLPLNPMQANFIVCDGQMLFSDPRDTGWKLSNSQLSFWRVSHLSLGCSHLSSWKSRLVQWSRLAFLPFFS